MLSLLTGGLPIQVVAKADIRKEKKFLPRCPMRVVRIGPPGVGKKLI